jgi:Fe2+ or Zn2+ uptake regulation protein
MNTPETLINLYRQKGLRITPQRRMIFELLSEDESHHTVDSLYQQLKERMPDVSLATVYNTVNELVALGELHNIEGRHAGGIHYDTITDPHHHLYCTQCHKLTDIALVIEPIELLPQETAGYQIERVQITYYGLCEDCQKGGSNA